jgi:hypothetical protein
MDDGLELSPQVIDQIRERMDIEQWALEHLMKMSDVQSVGAFGIYEGMMNSFILSLSPYWPEGFKERWDEIRQMGTDPKYSPGDLIHKERLTGKEMLKAELVDAIGIGFTKKKKARLGGGVKRLWELYPPIPPSNEPISKS